MECKNCRESIDDDASWCPKCQRPQSLIRALVPPQAIVVILIALGGYWFITMQAMEDSMSQFQNKSVYEGGDQITLSNVSFNISKDACETCVSTIGSVKNNTETPWANFHFQVTYYNADNEVIDVLNDEDTDLIVGPNLERKFKVKGKASAELSQYHHNSAVITKASPDSQWD